jgi:redox-sensitive bicupin YhaK (pirin superfamily)
MSGVSNLVPAARRDLGDGFLVLRAVPTMAARSVGPFVFVDHFGPTTMAPGKTMDVRPHPHIGLATVTYLFTGSIIHRDSLGTVQRIEPGAINWMTAGRGIVHSERTPEELRRQERTMHGMQTWIGLPEAVEESEPSFLHTPAHALPARELDGARAHVLLGRAFGLQSPVPTFSDTLYCAIELQPGATLSVAAEHAERALYVTEGALDVDGTRVNPGTLAMLAPEASVPIRAAPDSPFARAMLLGGEPLGHRFVWWNFVSSRRERIEQAKADWVAQRIGHVIDEPAGEFIPLPVH